MKKTGIELIALERQEQINKHGRSVEFDVEHNPNGELSCGAGILSQAFIPKNLPLIPNGWDERLWDKMLNKSYRKRLIIAGALIAAEIDRIQYTLPHTPDPV